MKGARINFGVPNSEYVLLADDDGVAVSLKNQDTDTEYVGGGSVKDVKITWNWGSAPVDPTSYALYVANEAEPSGFSNLTWYIVFTSYVLTYIIDLYGDYYYFIEKSKVASISGDYSEVEIEGYPMYRINGDVSITAAV